MQQQNLPQPARLDKRSTRRLARILPAREPKLATKNVIPVCEPELTNTERRYVNEVLDSGWISSKGPMVERFEKAFAKTVSHTKYAIAVNSGTSALHLALAAVGVGPGDEVIIPTFTMIATANAVAQTGARPILVDADPESWNIAVGKIEERVTARTKAILPVHLYGIPADMDPVTSIAKAHHLWVIEDAAQSHGAEYRGKRVGSIGDLSAFSLYANKIITTGEGGMLTTDNPEIAKRARLLRNYSFNEERHFWHFYLGFAYRMTALQAAIGLAQTERFTKLVALRRRHARWYRRYLSRVPGLTLPVEPPGIKNVFWMYTLLVEKDRFGVSRDTLRAYLAERGIETRSFFVPIHLQPIYHRQYLGQRFPVAERLCRDGMYLPSSPTLTSSQIQRICIAIRKASDTLTPRRKFPSLQHSHFSEIL